MAKKKLSKPQTDAKVDGIIMFPGRPEILRRSMRRASRSRIPIICVAADAPDTGRLAVVSVDTMVSGSLAADLLGRMLKGSGKVAVTLSDLAITEHAEKVNAFKNTLRSFYPEMLLQEPIEDHDIEAEAYDSAKNYFALTGPGRSLRHHGSFDSSAERRARYRRAGKSDHHHHRPLPRPGERDPIRRGHRHHLPASAHPGTYGVRVLHEFLVEGNCPSFQVTLAPHLVMRRQSRFLPASAHR